MKTGFIIFNGIRFPYYLPERAIAWAETNKAELRAIILKGKEEEEGYNFPSDLDAAESLTDKEDAERDDNELIRDNIKLLQDMAKSSGVKISADKLDDPKMEEVLNTIKDASIVFVDAKANPDDIAAPRTFNIQDLIRRLPVPVDEVSE